MRTVYVMRMHTQPSLMRREGKKGKGEKEMRKEGKERDNGNEGRE